MPIKLGIIGLSAQPSAWATRSHLGPLRGKLADKYTLTAVGGSSTESAQAAAEAHGLPLSKGYGDAAQLANDPDVDMVTIAVKVPQHKKLAVPALEAGKAVFVEWPLGNGLDEARALAAMAREKKVRTMVGLQARRVGSIVKARDIVKSGALGRIVSTSMTGHDSLHYRMPASQAYVLDIANFTNLVTIAGGHALDALCWILGEFAWLSATTAINFPTCQVTAPDGSTTTSMVPRTSPDHLAVQGCLRGGAKVSFDYCTTSEATPREMQWTIVGETGSLKLEGQSIMVQVVPPALFRSDGEGKDVRWRRIDVDPPMASGGVGELYEAFANGGGEGVVDFDGAVKRHEMLDAIFRSAESGRRESY